MGRIRKPGRRVGDEGGAGCGADQDAGPARRSGGASGGTAREAGRQREQDAVPGETTTLSEVNRKSLLTNPPLGAAVFRTFADGTRRPRLILEA
jgi:hypothetical protein